MANAIPAARARKSRARTSIKTLPLVGAAVLCDQVLLEKDDTPTVVRITNKMIVQGLGIDPPEDMPEGLVEVTVFLVLRAGGAIGPHTIQLRLQHPDNRFGPRGFRLPIVFATPAQEARITIHARLRVRLPGHHWIDVLCDGARLTRIPLEVEYQRVVEPAEAS